MKTLPIVVLGFVVWLLLNKYFDPTVWEEIILVFIAAIIIFLINRVLGGDKE
ncbi:MAG: hypothetical protein OIF51_12930 [Cellvibrionaceae bacterium]|nr:hypothetical protein [Cellvibrionaceae bacterium]